MANMIADLMPKISGTQIINVLIIIFIVVIIGSMLAIYLYVLIKKKRYGQYKIEIYDRDVNGRGYKEFDRGGVYLNKKTNQKLLWLEKYKVGLNPNKIPFTSTIDKKGRVIKTVSLRRIGVNNYVFLDLNVNKETINITTGEEDLNNAAAEMTKIRNQFTKRTWKDMLPFIAMMIISIMIIIMLIVLFTKFGVLKDAAVSLEETAKSNERVTEMLYNMSQSNSFNPNAPIIVPGG